MNSWSLFQVQSYLPLNIVNYGVSKHYAGSLLLSAIYYFFFSKSTFSENYFRDIIIRVKWFGSRSVLIFCCASSGSGSKPFAKVFNRRQTLGDKELTFNLLVSSDENLCKQFGPRSGRTNCRLIQIFLRLSHSKDLDYN